MDWQPTESAPRDGTRVLLKRKMHAPMKHQIVIGRWMGRSWKLDMSNIMSDLWVEAWQPLPAP